jgi:hypothetical protein
MISERTFRVDQQLMRTNTGIVDGVLQMADVVAVALGLKLLR